MEDEERVGRPSLVDHNVLLRAVEEERRQPLRKSAKKMGVSHTVVAGHLKLLGMVRKLDKWVPDDFTEQQQLKRFEVPSSLLIRNDAEPFLHRIETCGFYGFTTKMLGLELVKKYFKYEDTVRPLHG
nr:unnamed protein product [Haemonchus contortus]